RRRQRRECRQIADGLKARTNAAKKAAGQGPALGVCSAGSSAGEVDEESAEEELERGEGAISLDPPRLCRGRGGGELHPHQPGAASPSSKYRTALSRRLGFPPPFPLLELDLDEGGAGLLREVDDAREAACEIEVLSVDVSERSEVLPARWVNHPLRRVPSAPSTPRRLSVRAGVRSPLLPCPCDEEDDEGRVDAETCRSERLGGAGLAALGLAYALSVAFALLVLVLAQTEKAAGALAARGRGDGGCSRGRAVDGEGFGGVTQGRGLQEARQLGDGASCGRGGRWRQGGVLEGVWIGGAGDGTPAWALLRVDERDLDKDWADIPRD
ncbi:hypothetical protein C8F04DRAFT_1190604, partial [Mycena alexandri]